MNIGILMSSFGVNSFHQEESIIKEDICTGHCFAHQVLILLESLIDALKLKLEFIELCDACGFGSILGGVCLAPRAHVDASLGPESDELIDFRLLINSCT